jgi:YVTN family beta-propeller protein
MVTYSGTDKKAYVANIASGTVSMIDVGTNSLLRQLEFKKGIEGVTVSPDGMEVWVANREDSTVTAMSTKTFEKLAMMPAHEVAYRIKFLPDGNHVVVSNGMSGNLSVYDTKEKKHIKDIDLVDRNLSNSEEQPNNPVPVGIAVSTDSKFVYVSLAGYDQVVVIKTKDWSIEKIINTGSGPDGIYYSKLN